ncbi:unnamed protein product [Onchocerca ochengi]|uniref:Uncharacterized protein n=1 Tax=Onchocerca ochengi TaxID=42157 RepID=A0A182EMD0_ONCOC|nr:unnamed protein product [Onchocerca ochengi]
MEDHESLDTIARNQSICSRELNVCSKWNILSKQNWRYGMNQTLRETILNQFWDFEQKNLHCKIPQNLIQKNPSNCATYEKYKWKTDEI